MRKLYDERFWQVDGVRELRFLSLDTVQLWCREAFEEDAKAWHWNIAGEPVWTLEEDKRGGYTYYVAFTVAESDRYDEEDNGEREETYYISRAPEVIVMTWGERF